MRTTIKLITISTLAFLLIACGVGGNIKNIDNPLHEDTGAGPRDIRVREDQVSLVSSESLDFHSVSVIISAGQTPQNYFFFTLDRTDVKAGYSADDHDQTFTASASWNGRHYVESAKFPTYAHFVIKSLTEQKAVIEVSARLVDPTSGEFINLPRTLLNIHGTNLDVLTKKEIRVRRQSFPPHLARK